MKFLPHQFQAFKGFKDVHSWTKGCSWLICTVLIGKSEQVCSSFPSPLHRLYKPIATYARYSFLLLKLQQLVVALLQFEPLPLCRPCNIMLHESDQVNGWILFCFYVFHSQCCVHWSVCGFLLSLSLNKLNISVIFQCIQILYLYSTILCLLSSSNIYYG